MFQRTPSLKRNGSRRQNNEDGYVDSEALLGVPTVERRRSLVRPERNTLDDPENPHHYYAQLASQERDHLAVNPSSTGVDPTRLDRTGSTRSRNSYRDSTFHDDFNNRIDELDTGIELDNFATNADAADDDNDINSVTSNDYINRQGREIYGLNDEYDSPFRKKSHKKTKDQEKTLSFWQVYCYIITFWAPSSLLKLFGMPKKDRQMAWREKIALVSIILCIGTFIAYLTFGFTQTVCKFSTIRTRNNEVNTGYLIINGKTYDLTTSTHPEAPGIPADSNVLYPPINAGGMDGSFLFQNVNGNCKGLITPLDNSSIPFDGEDLAWYMPCKLIKQDGSSSPNFTTEYYNGWACHTSTTARDAYYSLKSSGDVYFTWDDIKNSSRNLVVYSGSVLDLDMLDWLQTSDLSYPKLFDEVKEAGIRGYDISLLLASSSERQIGRCLTEIIKVGVIDSDSIGCIASRVVLYVSLVFILSIVFTKFVVACYFNWFVSPRQGADIVNNKEMVRRANQIDDWAEDIDSPGPIKAIKPPPMHRRSSSKFDFLNSRRMSIGNDLDQSINNTQDYKYTPMTTMALQAEQGNGVKTDKNHSRRLSTTSGLELTPFDTAPSFNDILLSEVQTLDPDIIHPNVVPQPPIDFKPFGYPLAHVMTLVTCYSEDEEGLRTTLDSIATTDYPNSHKLILILCDGLIKGSGNDKTTPEIALDMMTDFSVDPENVKPYSYVAVAHGSKRHNMSKVYSGFYKYDNSTVPIEKQQRVPIITIVKCGTPSEASAAKPGNRGKRDSQIILMSFLQKITFDERMTELEYDILLNIWKVTGLLADFYEIVLMVDADTKVYPDSLTHMIGEMVKDSQIMGLCGETKIANKRQSWVTAIQVFEYYISHHQAKAFESVFGGVTCLPGCFCMYRIKAPKGSDGYWVPILANPDIVERYSDNVVDTLHKKNLLLLGEDRFLSTLMLKTFPKRKQIFVPKAVCKTIAPDKFKVLLSQRRRWINSTVHNLMELVLVKDLCGTFCFSMQFVIGIELIGTLILPAAISFTIYVIIFAIVSKPTPVLSLVLLALILGLPGVLIIVTASRWSYMIWMFIYLLALPVWNFVLPAYAYWKFDDFSWGDTRTIAGGNKDHEELEGEFDHSMIKMRRWREFERERKLNHNFVAPESMWDPAQDQSEFIDDDLSI